MDKLNFCNNLIQDLGDKISIGTQFSLISSSGLLRQLICDSVPVIPQSERDSGKAFNFWISFPNFEQSEKQTHDILEKHIGTNTYQSIHLALSLDMGNQLYPIKLKEYRTMAVVSIDKEIFTVEDIIEYTANKRGGIHLDLDNLSEKQKRLHDLSKSLSVQDQESLLSQISYIAENVLLSSSISGFYSGIDTSGKKINQEINFSKNTSNEEITSSVYYALFLQKNNEYSDAREIFNRLLKYASGADKKDLEAHVLSYMARLYYDQKNYKIAEHYYDKTIIACEELGDKEGEALAYAQKGHIFARSGDKEKALDLYNTACKLLELLNLNHHVRKVKSFIEDLG